MQHTMSNDLFNDVKIHIINFWMSFSNTLTKYRVNPFICCSFHVARETNHIYYLHDYQEQILFAIGPGAFRLQSAQIAYRQNTTSKLVDRI